MWSVRGQIPGLDPDGTQMDSLDLSFDGHRTTLQNLNQRLWSYINQVRRLESANQTLEQHIETELQRKSPVELKHLDSHLKSASCLQEQIESGAWEVAVLKLQFLGAELAVFDLKSRCEQEEAERLRVEAGLKSVLQRGAELEQEVTKLNQEAIVKEEELQCLQLQHQQDVRGLQGHSSGLLVEVRNRSNDSDLARQLQNVSWSQVTLPPLLDWSLPAPQVRASVPEEESERLELSTTAASLQRVLDQLRSENKSLETEAVHHMELVEERLQAFGSDAARLCEELQEVLDRSENQSILTETMNQTISELQEELQRYQRLLEDREDTRISSPSHVPKSFKAIAVPLKPTSMIPMGHAAPSGHSWATRAGPVQTGVVHRHSGFTGNTTQARHESRYPSTKTTTEERHGVTVNKPFVIKSESKVSSPVATKKSIDQPLKAQIGTSVSKFGSFEKAEALKTSTKTNNEVNKSTIIKSESNTVAKAQPLNAKQEVKSTTQAKIQSVEIETTKKVNGGVKCSDVGLTAKKDNNDDRVAKVSTLDNMREAKSSEKVVVAAKVGFPSTLQDTNVNARSVQAQGLRQINGDVKKQAALHVESKILREDAAKQSQKEISKPKEEAKEMGGTSKVEKIQEVRSTTKAISQTSEVGITRKTDGGVDIPSISKLESKDIISKEQPKTKVEANIAKIESSDRLKEVTSAGEVEIKSNNVHLEEKLVAINKPNTTVMEMGASTQVQENEGSKKVINTTQEIKTETRLGNDQNKPKEFTKIEQLAKDTTVDAKKAEVLLTKIAQDSKIDNDSFEKSAEISKVENKSEPTTRKLLMDTQQVLSKPKQQVQNSIQEKEEAGQDSEPQKIISQVKQEVVTVQQEQSPSLIHQKNISSTTAKTEIQPDLDSSKEKSATQTVIKHTENETKMKETKDSVSKTSAEQDGFSLDFDVNKAKETQEIVNSNCTDSRQNSETKAHNLEEKIESKPNDIDFKTGNGLIVVKVTEENKKSEVAETEVVSESQPIEIGIAAKVQEVKSETRKDDSTKTPSAVSEVISVEKKLVDLKPADQPLAEAKRNMTAIKPEISTESVTGNSIVKANINQNCPDFTSQTLSIEEEKASKEEKIEISQNIDGVTSNIGLNIPKDESVTSISVGKSDILCSQFQGSDFDLTTNLELQQDLEQEEEFLRLDEDAFCPQDLEEFDDIDDQMETELDFDEDLTEANARVRPVERYVLKESPPMNNSLVDFKGKDAISEGFDMFKDANKENEAGFGGVYREKESGKLEESLPRHEKVEMDALDHKSEDVLKRNFQDEEKIQNVQIEESLSKNNVDRWISGSLDRVERSETIDKESVNEKKVLENVKMADIACDESNSQTLKQVVLTETTKTAAVDIPKSEGSLETPFTPPASEWRVYGRSSSSRMSTSPPQNASPRGSSYMPQNLSQNKSSGLGVSPPTTKPGYTSSPQEPERALSPGRFGKGGSGEWLVYGGKSERFSRSQSQPFDFRALSPTAKPTSPIPTSMSPTEMGRFGKAGSGEWLVYNRDRMSQADTRPQALSPVPRTMSPTETGRFGKSGSGEWLVYGQNRDRFSQSPAELTLRARALSPTSPTTRTLSPTETGRFGKAGSGEWRVYGPNRERISQPRTDSTQFDFRAISPEEMVNSGMFFSDFGPDETELGQFNLSPRPLSPPPAGPYGRFGKADSGEWHIYGNSSTKGRLSKSASDERVTLFRPREVLAQRPTSPEEKDYKVYRSVSPTKIQAGGDQVHQSKSPTKVKTGGGLFDLRKRTLSPTSLGRFEDTGKKEWLVYKNMKDSDKLRKRQLSPPEVQRKLFFTRSDGKKTSGKNLISSIGKLVKSAKKDRSSKEGGRVITSSDGPIGSHEGSGKKERISVCKMAAMSMSKERSHDRKETVPPPSIQDWLSSSEPRPQHDTSKP